MILIVASPKKQQELKIPVNISEEATIIHSLEQFARQQVAVCIDFDFENNADRISFLNSTGAGVIIVNFVCGTCEGLPDNFVRMNAWPGFFEREIAECATNNDSLKKKAEDVFSVFGKKTEWVADTPGFISARIISMIINEAYYTLMEGVSTKTEIDTAMKLGTNYPMGPFEWCEKITPFQVYCLLDTLAAVHPKYTPCELLKKEAL